MKERKQALGPLVPDGDGGSRVQTNQDSQRGTQEATGAFWESPIDSYPSAPQPGLAPKLKAIENNRAKVYGDPLISHKAIGYTWRGILQNRFHELVIPEIDASLVAELLAGFKLTRASRPVFHQDSFDDLHVYVDFSERFRK